MLVTGMSGAGKSTALKILEDLAYEAIDNLPLSLLADLVRARGENGRPGPLALGIDSRTRGFDPGDIERYLEPLLGEGERGEIALLFLDCETEVLRRRFSETRRPHPLAHDEPVDEGIRRERALLGWVRDRADLTVNTSRLSVRDLRSIIAARFRARGRAGARDLRALLRLQPRCAAGRRLRFRCPFPHQPSPCASASAAYRA